MGRGNRHRRRKSVSMGHYFGKEEPHKTRKRKTPRLLCTFKERKKLHEREYLSKTTAKGYICSKRDMVKDY